MNSYQINFLISYSSTGVISLLLAVLVFLKNKRSPVNVTFAIYSFAIAFWCLTSIFFIAANDEKVATFWDRICLCGVVFIPTTFIHFTYTFLGIHRERIIKFLYSISLCFLLLIPTQYFIKGTAPIYKLKFFTVPNWGYFLFVAYCFSAIVYGITMLFFALQKAQGLRRQQLMYLFYSTLFGYLGGSLNYNLVFQIPPYEAVPFGNYCSSIYGIVVAYAIVKHRFMDIRVAVTTAGIFLGIYALTLGIPFYLFSVGHHLSALLLAILLGSGAPFIYSKLKREAEDKILSEERVYQHALIQASKGLNRKKTVDDIARLVVTVLSNAVRIKNVAFYLHDGRNFMLKNVSGDEKAFLPELPGDTPIASLLKVFSGPILLDELRHGGRKGEAAGREAMELLKDYPATVAIPLMRNDKVIGIIFLGEKASKAPFSDKDLSVLNVIADQTSLAVENAVHLEKTQRTFQEEMQDRRLRDLGMIGSSISHQVGNRLQVVVRFLERLPARFKDEYLDTASKEEIVAKLRQNFAQFGEVIDNAVKAAEISDALKTHGKLSKAPQAVTLKRLVKMSRTIAEAKHPNFSCEFVEDFDEHIALWANEATMQDVFFNMFDNSFDAIRIRMQEGQLPEGFVPRITVRAHADGDMAAIEITDNGVGFRPEGLEKAFIPFHTTKGTEKGTGLGLHVIREFIRQNHGTINLESEFGQWARITITFPLATEARAAAAKAEQAEQS